MSKIWGEMGHEVTSKHVIDPETTAKRDWESDYEPKELYERERGRLRGADVLVTEATIPSFGAGFLIDMAVGMKKPLLTLHYGYSEKKAPLMLRGRAEEINLRMYTEENVRVVMKKFFESVG